MSHSELEAPANVSKTGFPADLPEDVLLHLFTFLGTDDVLSLRQTCTHFAALSRTRWVWRAAFDTHVLRPNLPFLSLVRDIADLSAEELEHLTLRTTRLHANLSCAQPKPVRTWSFNVHDYLSLPTRGGWDDDDEAAVTAVHTLPGSMETQLFLCVLNDTHIAVWRVPRNNGGPFLFAEWTLPEPDLGQYIEVLPARDPLETPLVGVVTFARELNRAHVFLLRVDHVLGALVTVASRMLHVHEPVHLLLVSRANVLLETSNGQVIWTWRKDELSLLRRPHGGPGDVLAAELVDSRFLVLAEPRGVLILDVRMLESTGVPVPTPNAPRPSTVFHLPEGLPAWEEAALAVPLQHTRPVPGDSSLPPPLTLITLSRAGAAPAPLTELRGPQMLQRYELIPYIDKSHGGVAWSFVRGERYSAPSSTEVLVLGPTGHGAFLQTRVVQSAPTRCVAGFEVPPLPKNARSGGQIKQPAGPLYARRCAVGEAAVRRYRLMAYALDDILGRLIVGNRDGTIEVLDFV